MTFCQNVDISVMLSVSHLHLVFGGWSEIFLLAAYWMFMCALGHCIMSFFFFKEVNYLSKNYYYFPSLSHIYDFSFVSSLCHLFIFFKLKKNIYIYIYGKQSILSILSIRPWRTDFFPLMKEQIYYHKEGSIQIKESETTKTSNWQSQYHKYQHQ